MANQRLHVRLDCKEHCRLGLKELLYPARIENISLEGVLVCVDDLYPGLHVGEDCRLLMRGLDEYEYLCKIVRIEPLYVALRFVESHFTT